MLEENNYLIRLELSVSGSIDIPVILKINITLGNPSIPVYIGVKPVCISV